MNPQVASGGRSFRGAFQYYMHDRGEQTRDRIAWTHTENMLTDDPDKAWKVMAYTAKVQDRLKQASGIAATGRKAQKPVMAYSLSWHPDQKPDKDHMLEAALESLKALGLQEHEALVVAHQDTPHRHVHVVVNRIHPVTGKVASSSNNFRKLSELAHQYSVKHGLDYSPQRTANREARAKGQKGVKYVDPVIQQAWKGSTSGVQFKSTLEDQGYKLAAGRKRIVVVDPYGKTVNPLRHLPGVKARQFNDRLVDIDVEKLPEATALAQKVAAEHEVRKQQHKPGLRVEFSRASKKEAGVPLESHPHPERGLPKPERVGSQAAERTRAVSSLALSREQARYHRDRAAVFNHWQRKIDLEKEGLSEFYDLPGLEKRIKTLEKRCARKSVWKKLLGVAAREQAQLEALKRSYANASWRFDERMQALQSKQLDGVRQCDANFDEYQRKCRLGASKSPSEVHPRIGRGIQCEPL